MRGSCSDIAIKAEQIAQKRQRLNRIFAHPTNQPLARIDASREHIVWLSTDVAVDYGTTV